MAAELVVNIQDEKTSALPVDGWMGAARKVPSPNFNDRPAGVPVSLLVLHNISLPPAQFEGNAIERFFLNELEPDEHPYFQQIHSLKVSAHFLIRRQGELIQFVSVFDRAWHAGRSSFEGRSECNDFSVGIELEGTDDLPYSDAQYACLVSVTQELMAVFPAITPERIVGHEHVAPGRKTDPGPAFDWSRFLNQLSILKPKGDQEDVSPCVS
ncbi:1,6-anhydro-N-acetylmuramyl-L-alanine amidase AmpD [Mangrovitalea sediminis]|uniref:1,6-anhydro-N-acetylmuramyl-L-alanine amidase AmpD n=1 Tax=Mangrovitalea sediminis TaxID=1982043 RepID=UPI003872F331